MSVIENAIAYIQELFKESADGHGVDLTMRVSLMKSENVKGKMVYTEIYHI